MILLSVSLATFERQRNRRYHRRLFILEECKESGDRYSGDFHFREPRKGNYKYMPREQWKDMVKATCNGRTSLNQIARNIHSLSSGGCNREGDIGWGLLQEIKKLKLASEDETSILANPEVISMMDDLLEKKTTV